MLWHYNPVIWYISPNSFVIKCPDPTERWWIILICWLTFSTDSHSPSTHTECLLRIWEKWSLLMRIEIWFSECLQSQDAKEHYNQISLTSPFYSFFSWPSLFKFPSLIWLFAHEYHSAHHNCCFHSNYSSSLILKLNGDRTMVNTLNFIIDHWYFVLWWLLNFVAHRCHSHLPLEFVIHASRWHMCIYMHLHTLINK